MLGVPMELLRNEASLSFFPERENEGDSSGIHAMNPFKFPLYTPVWGCRGASHGSDVDSLPRE